jgi:ATP-binding cassette subfamily B protein
MTVANFLLRALRAALPLLILYVGKLIIDEVIRLSHLSGPNHGFSDPAFQKLWLLVGVEFALAVGADGLGRAITLLDGLTGDLFSNYTSVRIMTHAATLDLDQFEDAHFYDKMERARQQTMARTMLLTVAMSQVQDLVTMGFLAAGLAAFNPWLMVVLLLALLPAGFSEAYFNDRSYDLSRHHTPERRELDYLRYLGASDETAKEVKIFDLAGFFIDRFHALSARFYADNKKLATQRTVWGTFFAVVGAGGYYAAYVYIILKAAEGQITIGSLTFLAGSFKQMRSLLETVLSRLTQVAQHAMYLSDFFEFFEIKPRIVQAANPRPFPRPIGAGVTFENVGFQYANAAKRAAGGQDLWAVRNLSFTLKPGEKLALVGENGAGKTTLVKLLARLYDPTEGRILLDGVDLRDYDLVDLRRNIGVIFQDYLRYQMTLAQNVAAGNIAHHEDRPRIEDSARQSLADTVAEKLPRGYDQMLGHRFSTGIELSGGEWQKVALARAYMRDAQLLILDEPTSALDAKAEYEVFQRFIRLTENKSAVLISHRFSTVRMADRILVLKAGRIAEIGSHDELLKAGGTYAELFNLQAQGYR